MASLKIFSVFLISSILIGFGGAIIDSELIQSLGSFGKSDVLINFKGDNSEVIDSINQRSFRSRLSKVKALTKGLKAHTEESQGPVKEYLKKQNVQSRSFIAGNQMVVRSAPLSLLQGIDAFSQVSRIQRLPTVQLAPVTSSAAPQADSVTWGVANVKADLVWAMYNTTGEGVVVANIDTGVRGTHDALRDNFRQDHGWYDPYKFTSFPEDNNGHGSHTMGTIAGQGGIGVAPGAQWIACKGCGDRSCDSAQLLACGDWMLAPTNPDGSDPDPTKVPDIVSNSWGSSTGGSSWYNATIKAWTAAGILHAFAIGNSGPRCMSAGSPGDQPTTFSVGSIDVNNRLSSFSSKGPAGSLSGSYVKPDIAAPGSDVYSAWFQADDQYNTISGTSMACPHVAGTMALMLSAKRKQSQQADLKLPMIDVEKTIETTANRTGLTVGFLNPRCDGLFFGGNRYPNNQFGYGRIDAYAAVKATVDS